MSERPAATDAADDPQPLDLAEKGRRGGQMIALDRRLFMKFTAFGRCFDPHAAIKTLAEDGAVGALYVDANDPQGIGVMIAAEDPEYFVTNLRAVFSHPERLLSVGGTQQIVCAPRPGVYRLRVPLGVTNSRIGYVRCTSALPSTPVAPAVGQLLRTCARSCRQHQLYAGRCKLEQTVTGNEK